MEDQKVELPILRRDSGGSNEWPKSGIAYTTARFWWLRRTTKKLNCLYYGEILVVKKIEFPILRRDLGFSNERAKNGITYATARSWGGPKSPKSLTLDGNLEKSMENYEKRMNRWCNTLKNDEKTLKIDETWWKIMKLNDQLSQDCRSHTSKTQRPPLKGVTCGRDRQSLPFLRVRPPHCGIAHPPLLILDELLWSKRAYDLGRCIVKKVLLSKLLVNVGVVLLGGVCLIPWASALNG